MIDLPRPHRPRPACPAATAPRLPARLRGRRPLVIPPAVGSARGA
ncbi:hypothetical protein [Blastococcus brunescens]|uniref:Uncharacterized protein n=1 Tax=Blastococcus brunescens TaxID=1564165 RepID=A0ABZ1AXH0_9ACTN|nr:hypothetical protein [Blastococcus sp. BMG 8361]WRL63267.1 hypothetical protein U6N30_26445 [Blastococcus sp. BMG 8361]